MKGSTVCLNKSRSRKGKKVCRFTPHYACGNMGAEEFANWLVYNDERGDVSCNYYIASDGTIWGIVPEELGPWTSSSAANDEVAITVEVADVNDSTGEITQAAWNSLVALGADVCTRYGFQLQWEDSWSKNGEWNNHKDNSLTIHRMFSSTDCPGQYLMDHLSQLASEVNAKIGDTTNGSSGGDSSSSTSTSASGDAFSKIPQGVITLEFSYGYHDGQMSEVHRGVMTEYDIDFSPFGARLTIEGVSTEFISFNDPNSVTYKGMTIEEIIRSIAEEEGWIVDDDSIEPIAEVEESTVYSLTTVGNSSGSSIYDNNSSGSSSGSGGSGGTIQDGFINEVQKRVIQGTSKVSFQGTGWCAMWVSKVFRSAGLGYPGGNADDMYYSWCNSENRSDLKPGMIVAVAPSGATGNRYGHVGIYIGDGIVRHNSDHRQDSSLDEFISIYGPSGSHPHNNPVKWGWMEGRDLTKETG